MSDEFKLYGIYWLDNHPTIKHVETFIGAMAADGLLSKTKRELYQHWYNRLSRDIQQLQECLTNLESAVNEFNDEE